MKKLFLPLLLIFLSGQLLSQDKATVCPSLSNDAAARPTDAAKGSLKPVRYPCLEGSNVPAGITESFINCQSFIPTGKLYPDIQTHPIMDLLNNETKQYVDANWNLWDSLYLDAYVPSGSNMGVKIDLQNRKLELVTPYTLCPEAKSAIRKSPAWIRHELEITLSRLSLARQKVFADVINNAQDKYTDEIAFSIAYSSPSFLGSSYCNPQLFDDNACLVYEHDKDLPYVEIVDYGTPASVDGNYYSTVKYWRSDSAGNKSQVEVPREIYYFYIVHPKLSDEIPAYIDPELEELNNDHASNISTPPIGVFWRDYLYTHTEEVPDTTDLLFPVLKNQLSKCEVLWDDASKSPMAIKAITKWIQDVMDFGSGNERPHQPVRIYDLHLGRCGEHEDITNAAARSCLIPSRGIDAFSSDHVWNEFWDKEWWQWEPVNNSHKEALVYEKGWGKKFGSFNARRSDGVTIPVTDRYSEIPCTVIITVLDKNNKPVDGAFVMLAARGTIDETGIFIDAYGITGNDGKYTFLVSAQRDYFARADTKIGNNPTSANQVVNLAPDEGFQKGQTYEFTVKVAGAMPEPDYAGDQPIDTSAKDYMLKINFSPINSISNWKVSFDDLSGGTSYDDSGNGKINMLVTDEENFTKSMSNKKFSAIKYSRCSAGASDEVILPGKSTWYAFLNNSSCLNNYIHVNASFALYLSPSVSVNEINARIDSPVLFQNCPNPFNSVTTIRFSLAVPSFARLYIINSTGITVRNLLSGRLENNDYTVQWDGKDNSDIPVLSGTYFYVLDTGIDRIFNKMILIR